MTNCDTDKKRYKKLLLIDLDGVLNLYNGNYDENKIFPIRDGAFLFLKKYLSAIEFLFLLHVILISFLNG